MAAEFIKALSLIFIAEMGDKTQIIAMTFATQFLVGEVLAGVALGVLANHGIAILLGSLLGSVLPMDNIQLMAGVLFIFFGFSALKVEDEDQELSKKGISPVFAVAMAFFVGELGDKTQLTAMALSAEAFYPFIILMGTTAGMIATSGMGIYVGSRLGRKIPEVALKIASSTVFLLFGIQKITTGLIDHGLPLVLIILPIAFLIMIEIYFIISFRRKVSSLVKELPLKQVANLLYEKASRLKNAVDDLCLGEGACGGCAGSGCLMGYTKSILNEAKLESNYYNIEGIDLKGLLIRSYDRNKLEGAYILVLRELDELGWIIDEKFVINRVREAFEVLLFDKKIPDGDSLTSHLAKVRDIDQILFSKIEMLVAKEESDER
jgi:putative Ca2+/H+ antiporter (TMEM165/GDT1 family)